MTVKQLKENSIIIGGRVWIINEDAGIDPYFLPEEGIRMRRKSRRKGQRR